MEATHVDVVVVVIVEVVVLLVENVVVGAGKEAQEQAELIRTGEFWHCVAYEGRPVVAV